MRWRGLALLGLIVGLTALALGLVFGSLWLLKDASPFWAEAWRQMFSQPVSYARLLTALSVALVLVGMLLTPFALAESRALRRFGTREEELRRDRVNDVVTPYSGVEGEGVAFDGPDGRLLLLRPEGGLGLPREVVLPHPEAEPPSPTGSSAPPTEG